MQHIRLASTTEVPGVPSSAEPSVPLTTFPKITLPLIPDASRPVPEPVAQIVRFCLPLTSGPLILTQCRYLQPFTPDFWESSRVKAAEQPQEAPETPNLIAVAGDATHISASPSHNLFTASETATSEPVKSSKDKTLLEDLAEDMFLPTSFPKLQTEGADLMQVTNTSGAQEKDHSRTLDREEKNGLWVLLGVFLGSWVAAGAFQAPSKFAAKAEEVVEEAAGAAKTAKH